jgi:cytidylate kinase
VVKLSLWIFKRTFFTIFASYFSNFYERKRAKRIAERAAKEWQTLAEQTDYRKSWNYADTIRFRAKIG